MKSLPLALILLFCGCKAPEAVRNTTAPATLAIEPATEPTELAPIDNKMVAQDTVQ